MNLILFLLLGGLVGWAASRVTGRDDGIVANVLFGIFGSIIGGILSAATTGSDKSALAFSWPALLWSFAGAVVLVMIVNSFRGAPRNQ